MRKLLLIVVLLVVALAAVYVGAGFAGGPKIEIVKPETYVGVSTPLEVVVEVPRTKLSSLEIDFEQDKARTPLFSLATDGAAAQIKDDGTSRVRITQTIGRDKIPNLKSGAGRIVVTAARSVLFGIRRAETEAARDVKVRLERPKLAVLSTHHYVNLGGTELAVYQATPADVQSGVLVGNIEYPGFPGAGAQVEGAAITDPSVRVAFFALRYDQPLNTPIRLFARDEAGNTALADFEYRVFPKPFKKSRIELDTKLLERVVPAILATTTDIKPTGALIDQFVAINSELRRKNAEKIVSYAGQTAKEMLWGGAVFYPFTNTSAESAFADHRTYIYNGREVDRQVHLGFDLASYAGTPIVAANRGKVLFADMLGIYGNTVIIDHGMGVQSLYAHLSAMDVAPGAMVDKSQQIGRSGMTGLAAGDHLHFTMLVNGQMVNPIEWWDSHWIEDRILRKLRAAK